jgi:formate dehydrogenase iron-sulfur subunit
MGDKQAVKQEVGGPAAEVIAAALAAHRDQPGALLPILHDIVERLGYLPAETVALVADGLNLSRAEVHGVITFYPDFRTEPPGRHVLRVCRAEACQAMGAEQLITHLERRHHVTLGKTRDDGALTAEPVYCLGNCALSPAITLDGQLHGKVTPQSLDAALDSLVDTSIATAPFAHPHAAGPAVPSSPPRPHLGADADARAITVYIPRDSAALSAGADDVARAFAAACAERPDLRDVRLVRNGSRGLLWLEPLVEVATPAGRVAYGPVTAADLPSLLAASFLTGGDHPLRLGPTEELPYLANQERLTFARVGITDPVSVDDYQAHGGFRGLRNALAMEPATIVEEVTRSGLRGRGGAAFPAGLKWKTVLSTPSPIKYVVCNADEGDSGTFSDRMIMEGDPLVLIEGMTIAGLATGATHGYIYLRSEYPHAEQALHEAIAAATSAGFLGDDLLGSGRSFTLEVRRGAGAYICGEETAMLESLEGKRGEVRPKPPLPAIAGLFGKPTVINNVITLASVPIILDKGGTYYAEYGMGRSRGTLPFQLAGNLKRGGLVEKAFGLTLRQLLEEFGGGTASGRPIKAVQLGGPLGAYLPPAALDTPLDYEAIAKVGGMIGHGGLVVFDDTVDMARMARYAMEFCAVESCGKCTPCRVGSTRGVEVIDRIRRGEQRATNLSLLRDLCDTLLHGSLCAMGGMTPLPVLSALDHYPEDFGAMPVKVSAGAASPLASPLASPSASVKGT